MLGTPTSDTWPEGMQLASKMSYKWPRTVATPLDTTIKNASADAVDLMYQVCRTTAGLIARRRWGFCPPPPLSPCF